MADPGFKSESALTPKPTVIIYLFTAFPFLEDYSLVFLYPHGPTTLTAALGGEGPDCPDLRGGKRSCERFCVLSRETQLEGGRSKI